MSGFYYTPAAVRPPPGVADSRPSVEFEPNLAVIGEPARHAALKAVITLFQRWGLTDAEARALLGEVSSATYTRWKRGEIAQVGVDLLTRLSALLGIHKALRLLYADDAAAYRWIRSANAELGGVSPLALMRDGQIPALLRVRNYLDAARG